MKYIERPVQLQDKETQRKINTTMGPFFCFFLYTSQKYNTSETNYNHVKINDKEYSTVVLFSFKINLVIVVLTCPT